ncbi:uncharacterized protein C18orf63 homolog isoform X2 [Lissotriton helveticus]
MNEIRCESLFFTTLPDLRTLCAVKIFLSPDINKTSLRDAQIKLCRYLLFRYQDVVTSPVPDELNQILLITSIPFYKAGKIQAVVVKHGSKMEPPLRVTPALLQTCLSYTLTARLAPTWNKAGHLLIQVMDLYVSETQLCISLTVHTVRLPPPELGEFDISASTIRIFGSSKFAVIPVEAISSNWCYVLPSMKMGQIMNVHHTIPPESPFLSYKDLQLHWRNLYGYKLPEDHDDDIVYCSVYFKPIGERLFTYPFCCLRSQPVQFFPRTDLDGVLTAFITDLKCTLPHLCGYPVRMTSKPCYSTKQLSNPNIQTTQARPVNLSGKTNLRACMTEVPAIKSTSSLIPAASCTANYHKMALFSSQPTTCIFTGVQSASDVAGAASTALKGAHLINSKSAGPEDFSSLKRSCSQNDTTARIIPIFKTRLLQMSQVRTKTIDKKKKVSVSQNAFNVLSISEKENTSHNSAVCMHVLSQSLTSDVTSAAKRKMNEHKDMSPKKVFRPRFIHKDRHGAMPLKNSAGENHTMMDHSLQESSQQARQNTLITEGMVKVEAVSRHLKNKNSRSKPPSKHALETNRFVEKSAQPQKLYLDTEMATPQVACRNKTQIGEETLRSNINIMDPAVSRSAQKPDANATKNHALKLEKEFTMMASSQCVQFNHRSDQEEMFKVKHKKSKICLSIQDVDVEQHAKNNQLSKLNSATLQSWLKQRGISIRKRDKKEELVSKIMQFISEL